MKKIKEYFSTHFAASFVLILFITFSLFLLFFEGYLRRVYYQYLVEQSYEEENNIIHYVRDDLNQTLRNLLLQGSRTAVDQEIYEEALLVKQNTGAAGLNNRLNLTSMLKRSIISGDAVVTAVASSDGILAYYDRLKTTTQDTFMWTEDKKPIVREMASNMITEAGMAKKKSLPRVWIYTEPSVHPARSRGDVFHMVLPVTGGKVSVWNTGFILISTYSVDLLTDVLDSVNIPRVDYVKGFITDAEGNILFYDSGHQDITGKEKSAGKAGTESGQMIKVLSEDLGYFGWSLNIEINEYLMRDHVSTLFKRGTLISLGILALVILLMLYLFGRMMRPVGLLSESMKEAEEGVLNTKVEIAGKHEIWQVAEEYNRMIETLEEKNKELEEHHRMTVRSIEQQHAAEWEALESQINAHFICNTLGCINYEAMEAGNHEVSLMLKKLSNILRYTLDQKRQEVMIYQELAWVDQYLYLQKLRREDLFDYDISFPEVYGQWPCCKLMFQPFVENSIMHGFMGMEKGGLISIRAEMEGDRLKVEIEDNGCGMDPEQAEKIRRILDGNAVPEGKGMSEMSVCPETENCPVRKAVQEEAGGTGVGVRNVVTRMRMFFGRHFEAELWTEEGKGTRFTFLLPIPEMEKDMEE